MSFEIQLLITNAQRYIRLKEFERAQELLIKALNIAPDDPDVLRLMSVNSALQFRFEEALKLIDKAIFLAPENGVAHSNRCNILKELHRYEDALSSIDKAINLLPQYAEAYSNKGNVLQEMYRFEEAISWYEKAIQLQPNFAEAYSNKGNALEWLRRHDEAIKHYDMATAVNPHYIDAYWHKSLNQLASGNYELGWQNYEARWLKNSPVQVQYQNIPRLQNIQQTPDKNILVWAEQGLGDTLQFCRFIKPLAEQGAQITFVIPKPLLKTLQSLGNYCRLVEAKEIVSEEFDYQSPLLSLPLLLGTTVDSIPSEIPYLKATPDKVASFASKMHRNKNLKVGVVWNGGFRLDYPELWDVNRRRNIDFSLIAKLKDIPRVDFYSMQKGEPAESEFKKQKEKLWPNLIDLTELLEDFSDTAALIQNLDLVISVDTSTPHLAGALGKPVWILNRYDSCWRWLRGRQDTPWYPTMRIYQQQHPNEWDLPLEQVKTDLANLSRVIIASNQEAL